MSDSAIGPHRLDTSRRVVGLGLLVAILPYAVMKVLWLAGVPWGVPADSPAASDEFRAANAITLGMDVVAAILALALTARWGERLPAALVIPTCWIGIGFLLPTVIQVPIGYLLSAVTTGDIARMDDGLVTDEMYMLVYGSFMAQGLFLAAAVALYFRSRWPFVFELPASSARGDVFGRASTSVAYVGAGAATVVGAINIIGAVLAPATWHDDWTLLSRSSTGIEGLAFLVAVPGILAIVRSPLLPGLARARRTPAVLMMIGSGALASWGGGRTIAQLASAPLSETLAPIERLANPTAALAGLLIGLVGLLALARSFDTANPHPGPQPLGMP